MGRLLFFVIGMSISLYASSSDCSLKVKYGNWVYDNPIVDFDGDVDREHKFKLKVEKILTNKGYYLVEANASFNITVSYSRQTKIKGTTPLRKIIVKDQSGFKLENMHGEVIQLVNEPVRDYTYYVVLAQRGSERLERRGNQKNYKKSVRYIKTNLNKLEGCNS